MKEEEAALAAEHSETLDKQSTVMTRKDRRDFQNI
jgi:hypothetical protein